VDEVVQEAARLAVAGTNVNAVKANDALCSELAARIASTFDQQSVRFVIVENGTLPDNPLFTEALYRAISDYGNRHGFGKYVLWHDHDLMWSAEPHRFGAYPYSGVRKPKANQHVEYSVSTDWMRKRMQAWSPGLPCHIIPDRFFVPPPETQPRKALRAQYGIPKDAYLIARCTRVVPQKSIERDLRLLGQLQRRLSKPVFLFITGPTTEDPAEFEYLRALARKLFIADQVIWGDGLLPFNRLLGDPAGNAERLHVFDLLAEADLSSFLTTYDYEGFGNPPGEAMAARVPFIATTYELYQDVYGSKGVIAPLLAIDRATSPADPMPEDFLAWTVRALTDDAYRKQTTAHNLEICQRFFSLDALERQVVEIFDIKVLESQ
ncbi:MAG TPA: glycosyltransferase family 4 protein, partial [Thermoanaerobaculia bacterium]|nr:glycosyltransferase family 4 protein [Thermoanaerobaculia bacterium]